MHSVEQNSEFHLVRRMRDEIAPDFRLFATSALQPGECVLDLKAKTIEIGEGTHPIEAVGGVLFQLGHIRLMKRKEFQEHFGNFPKDISEEVLVRRIVTQGIKADKYAYLWAFKILYLNWDVDLLMSKKIVSQYMWSEEQWKEYYKAAA